MFGGFTFHNLYECWYIHWYVKERLSCFKRMS